MIHKGIYAGIGSRKTPVHILDQINLIAQNMAQQGYMLRSGGALGADTAFEIGCRSVNGAIQTYTAKDAETRNWLIQHAAKYHPNWGACSRTARLLHARNSAIMCGAGLGSTVDCVICWTPEGEVIGGTGQALRIAKAMRIPVFNLGDQTGVNLWGWLAGR